MSIRRCSARYWAAGAFTHGHGSSRDNIDAGTVAGSVISTYQSDRIALKLVMEVDFKLRNLARLGVDNCYLVTPYTQLCDAHTKF